MKITALLEQEINRFKNDLTHNHAVCLKCHFIIYLFIKEFKF